MFAYKTTPNSKGKRVNAKTIKNKHIDGTPCQYVPIVTYNAVDTKLGINIKSNNFVKDKLFCSFILRYPAAELPFAVKSVIKILIKTSRKQSINRLLFIPMHCNKKLS